MLNAPVPQARRLKREKVQQRGNVVINFGSGNFARREQRYPCTILDSSREGLRLRGTFGLRRGQIVEVIWDDDPLNSVRCNVIWVSKSGPKHEGEAGLETSPNHCQSSRYSYSPS